MRRACPSAMHPSRSPGTACILECLLARRAATWVAAALLQVRGWMTLAAGALAATHLRPVRSASIASPLGRHAHTYIMFPGMALGGAGH